LRKKSFNFSSSLDYKFVLIRKLLHTKYSYYIHKFFVFLQCRLNFFCNLIVFFSNYINSKHRRSAIKWIYGWIYSFFCNSSSQNYSPIQMTKCSSGSWIGQIISWYIYSLKRCNRSFVSRCNPFL